MNKEETNRILHVLKLRAKALAFNSTERGQLKERYADQVKAATVPHNPWKERPILIPRALRDDVIELLRERRKEGLYEPWILPYSC